MQRAWLVARTKGQLVYVAAHKAVLGYIGQVEIQPVKLRLGQRMLRDKGVGVEWGSLAVVPTHHGMRFESLNGSVGLKVECHKGDRMPDR